MSEEETEKLQSTVRLRVAERRQMEWVAQCRDDLAGPGHPVRLVMAVVEKMDLSDFHEPIKSRDGQAGPAMCHMHANPSSDIAHTEVTDHRIPRRPTIGSVLEDAHANSLPSAPHLVPFPDSPALTRLPLSMTCAIRPWLGRPWPRPAMRRPPSQRNNCCARH